MLAIAALMLAAAPVNSTPALASASPWWERFTFTMNDDGVEQACQYQSSTHIPGSEGCGTDASADEGPASMTHSARASTGSYTKITVERRYSPGGRLEPVKLETGDTLLGEHVLALSIDGSGSVTDCKVIGTSGKMTPPYGCDEARSERFEAGAIAAGQQLRQGFMTVLVYGHEEYPV